MTLTVLFDNYRYHPGLRTGWGFAAWLEYGGRVVLFDTGANGAALLANMAALGLDPKAVEMVVLSHIHGDHTGGLAGLLAVNPQVTIYLPQAFPSRFKAQVRAGGARVVEVDAPAEILPGLWSTGQMGADIVEQALVVRTALGLIVVTGCAHPGIDQMVARAKEVGKAQVHLVMGGFHLGGASQARVDEIIATFRSLGVQQVAPCHCTGDKARALFREAYGQDFLAIGAGWQWQRQPVVWAPSSQGIPAQAGVAAAAVALGDPQVVYLAAYDPPGLHRSDDGGASWQNVGQRLEALAPLAIAAHPGDPDLVWVGTMAGGYRTTDGGQSWQPMAGLPSVPLYALAVGLDGETVYAGGEATGIWRSDDGGRAWAESQAASGPDTVLSLAITPDGRVLAGTAGQGVWTSEDGGEQWQPDGSELAHAHVSHLTVVNRGRSYALAEGNLYVSDDRGQSWQRIASPEFEALSLAAEPGPSGRLYLGSKGMGLAVSQDGGRSWDLVGSELGHADITVLVVDPVTPGRAYLGTRHNGLHRTDDGGASWTLTSAEVGRPMVGALAEDPADPQVLYAGTLDGVYRSEDGGEYWQLMSGAMGKLFVQSLAVGLEEGCIYAGARSGIYLSENRGATWQWAEDDTAGIAVFSLLVDPHDGDRLYAGSWGHNILLTTDAGQTWAPVHQGLETLSVHALAVDPSDPRVLYAGTVEAVYRTADAGSTWRASPLSDRPLTTFALAIDPKDPARLYAGTTEGVYGSTTGGRSWQAAGTNSLDATVTALIVDPEQPSTVYAGTEHHGLFRSTDGGEHWQAWGLDGASVYAILVDSSRTIWLGTDRGIFRDR